MSFGEILENAGARFFDQLENQLKEKSNKFADDLANITADAYLTPGRLFAAFLRRFLDWLEEIEKDVRGFSGSPSPKSATFEGAGETVGGAPSLSVDIPHDLSQEEALRRMEKLGEDLKKEFGGEISNLQGKWEKFSGHFTGKIRGREIALLVIIERGVVKITLTTKSYIPGFMKKRIEKEIRKRIESVLV